MQLLHSLLVSLALVLHYNYVLHEGFIGSGNVAWLLFKCLANIISRDFGWFNIGLKALVLGLSLSLGLGLGWDLSLTSKWLGLVKATFRLAIIKGLLFIVIVVVDKVFELLDLLLKRLVVDGWLHSLAKACGVVEDWLGSWLP
jgi:hypothetical protein